MQHLQQPEGTSTGISDARLAIDRAVFSGLAGNVTLESALATLCQTVEQQCPGLFCSILVLGQAGARLFHAAAPSLPASFSQAINGVAVGPNEGLFGAAAYRKEDVIVSDIASDPRVASWRDLALKHGLRACRLAPVISSEGSVLGMFAVYCREARPPNSQEQELIQWTTPLIAIMMERKRADDSLGREREPLHAEAASQMASERLGMAMWAAGLSMWDCDVPTGKVYLSEGWSVLLGGEPQETHTTVQELLQITHPEDQERVWRLSGKNVKGEIPRYREEHRVRNSTGKWIWVESTGKVVSRDRKGRVLRMMGTNVDISERKHREEALRHSEANHRSMMAAAPYGIYCVDPDGKFLFVNPALVEMLGYDSPEELMSVNINKSVYLSSDERARLIRENPGGMNGVEAEWKRKDGALLTVRLGSRAVRDAGGNITHYEVIGEDVTEKRELERQLLQAQKMDAVGRLAGGIAHDFNNLLTIIGGHLALLQETSTGPSPHFEGIEQAQKAADRAVVLTRQLLTFSRMQFLQPKIINLNAVVTEIAKLLPPLLGANIELVIVPGPNLGCVKADPGQIEQVILNLAANARDAMPAGGKLVVETANVALNAEHARLHPPLTAGQYVMLAVSDPGVGIDAETQARIFEPFFTTKEKGKGTGLGLSTVYGIVKQSNGHILVDSTPGRGTKFRIYLPLVKEPADTIKPVSVAPRALRGNETVLLVEDEKGVRQVAWHYLNRSGYTVLEARNGREALEIARQYPHRIHVLITDMVMPGIGGSELAKQMALLQPETRVVYMSGYSETALFEHNGVAPDLVLLPKPFTQESLTSAVRDAIDRGAKPKDLTNL